MWLFTNIGFFSIVQKKGDAHLTVRGRVAADLDRLRTQFMPELSATISKAGTDYPYRTTIGRAAFAKGLAKVGEAIHYHNFKDEVAEAMGKPRASRYGKVWSVLYDMEEDEPAAPAVKSAPARRGYSYGGVLINAAGEVLLREPANHYDGYVWTFPKGGHESGETEEEAALREVREETGIEARILKRIPGEFQGGTSKCIFYLMSVLKDTGELEAHTQSVVWVNRAEAERRIHQTTNAIGRKRDLQVLQAAFESMD